jgi:hypothetical protein
VLSNLLVETQKVLPVWHVLSIIMSMDSAFEPTA